MTMATRNQQTSPKRACVVGTCHVEIKGESMNVDGGCTYWKLSVCMYQFDTMVDV